MRVLHCCLAAFYIDDYGYQENILPKMHKQQGHDVAILASTETYLENKALGNTTPGSYVNKDGIPVSRIPYSSWFPKPLVKKLRIYKGIQKHLTEFAPDVIFLHDCQFISIIQIAHFAAQNRNVVIYVDSHTDFINSGKNWLSKHILHKVIYKWCAKKIEPFTTKFYGTLPLRNTFYKEVYDIDESKLELLVLGADITSAQLDNRETSREIIRKHLGIAETDFVLITGGKLDERKNIHLLIEAFSNIKDQSIHLICFGLPTDSMKDRFEQLKKIDRLHYLGWLNTEQIYEHLFSADLAVFPGTHSVLWEQAVGSGLPCIFKKWDGIQHVDIGGNCTFISEPTISEIKNEILAIRNNRELYLTMKKIASEKGMKEFSYYEIAKRAIELN